MMTIPKQGVQCDVLYGNPRGVNGLANATWERKNLVYIVPPYPMVMGSISISKIRINRACAASLERVLKNIWTMCGKDYNTIKRLNYHVFSGSYNYRLKRNGSALSMHAYGAAIDFDAPNNMMGDKTPGFTPESIIVKAFEQEGWVWGGRWKNGIDGMHFQCAKI
jgi:hypothetical protein